MDWGSAILMWFSRNHSQMISHLSTESWLSATVIWSMSWLYSQVMALPKLNTFYALSWEDWESLNALFILLAIIITKLANLTLYTFMGGPHNTCLSWEQGFYWLKIFICSLIHKLFKIKTINNVNKWSREINKIIWRWMAQFFKNWGIFPLIGRYTFWDCLPGFQYYFWEMVPTLSTPNSFSRFLLCCTGARRAISSNFGHFYKMRGKLAFRT